MVEYHYCYFFTTNICNWYKVQSVCGALCVFILVGINSDLFMRICIFLTLVCDIVILITLSCT